MQLRDSQNQSIVGSESVVEPAKVKHEIVDLTDAAAQINSIDQSLIQEAHEKAILRTSSSTNQELSQDDYNEEPQPSTSAGFNSNLDHERKKVRQNEEKSADSKIKDEECTFEHEASHLDKEVKNEVKLKTENVHNNGDGTTNAAPEAEVKQEENSGDRILETSQETVSTTTTNWATLHSFECESPYITYDNDADDQMISHKMMKLATTSGLFRLTIRLRVKLEGEGRILVEKGIILKPGDPITLRFSTIDRDIRLVMSQSKIENRKLEFFSTFDVRSNGSELEDFQLFDLERVTNHLTIKTINCPTTGENDTETAAERTTSTTISGIENSNDDEHGESSSKRRRVENSNDDEYGESSSKRRRVENSNSRQGAVLSSSLLPQPVPSRSRSRSKSTSLEPNHESNGNNIIYHTCEENTWELCPACYQFKFEYMGEEEVIVVAGTHSFNFKMELSYDVRRWLLEREPRIRLVTLPNSKDFDLLTKFAILKENPRQFESQELEPDHGYTVPVEIKFRSSHKYVPPE